ncbi:ABC transporter substrate-binding protein [Nonomuraea sp. K274]|uniref:ABC transporter substrate-binding protein n=1 Tax=Nonomuraea cypriaca TaxID=1187855 RepID=A0A931EW89_9ACTN|nr:ABC transporter substrate-binding protein [Nonomuraea cypriaca]MBF8184222.1 ABC transporter substrate-binding protein [Nonomuraea cypriaca]
MSHDWSELSGDRVSRRTLLRYSLGGAAALTLAACGSSGSPAESAGAGSQQARRGGSIKAAWNIDRFLTLDPQRTTGFDQLALLVNIVEGLTRLTPELDVEGALAESWKVSEDGKTYTFKLRKNVVWHNGDEFDAQDIIFTHQRATDPELGSANANLPPMEVTAPDDHTIVMKLEQPSGLLLTQLTAMPGAIMGAVNKRALTEMGADKYGLTPVGTGPFKVTEHVPGDHLTLTRHDKYWEAGFPLLDEVVIDLVPEPTTVQSALLSGDVQFAHILRPQSYEALRRSPNLVVVSEPGVGWSGMWMNYKSTAAPYLADPRVRLAFAKAIDRKTLIQKALFGQGDPGYGPYSLAVKWAYDPKVPTSQDYDLAGAQKLMSDANVSNVSLDFMTTPGFERTDQVLADMLGKIGVQVRLTSVEKSVYSARGYRDSNYSILHSGSASDPDPDDSVYKYFTTDGATNTFGYSNPKVDDLIAKERVTPGRAERAKILWEIQNLLISDVAAVFTYHSRDLLGMSAQLKGYQKVPELRSLRTVWLDK